MASRQFYTATNTDEQTVTSSAFGDGVSLTFTPDANATYVIFYSFSVKNSAVASTYTAAARIYDATASELLIDAELANYQNAGHTQQQLIMTFYTAGASPTSRTFKGQVRCVGYSANTASFMNQRLFIMRLESGDLTASGSDYDTTSTSFVDALSLTINPGSSTDYIIIAMATARTNSTTADGRLQLYDGTNEVFQPLNTLHSSYDGLKNGAWTAVYPFSTANGTIKIRHRRMGGSGYNNWLPNARILALKRSNFDDHSAVYTGTDATTTTSASWVDGQSHTDTPSGNPALVIGCTLHRNSTSAAYSRHQFLADGAAIYPRDGVSYNRSITKADLSQTVFWYGTPTAESHTWKHQHRTGGLGTSTLPDQSIVYLDLGTQNQTYQVATAITAATAVAETAVERMPGAVPVTAAAAVTDAAAMKRAGAVPVTATATVADAAAMRRAGATPITAAATVTEAAVERMPGAVPVTAATAVTDAAAMKRVGATPVTAAATASTAAVERMPGAGPVTAATAVTDAAAKKRAGATPVTAAATVTDAAAMSLPGATPVTATATVADAAVMTRAGAVPVDAAVTASAVAVDLMTGAVPVGATATVADTAIDRMAGAAPVTADAAVTEAGAALYRDSATSTVAAAVGATTTVGLPGAVPVGAAVTVADAAIDRMAEVAPLTADAAVTEAAIESMAGAAPLGVAAGIGHNAGISAEVAFTTLAEADEAIAPTQGLAAAAAMSTTSVAAAVALQRILDGAAASIVAQAIVDAARRGVASAQTTAQAAAIFLGNTAGSGAVVQTVDALFGLSDASTVASATGMAAEAGASSSGAERMPGAIAADAWAAASADSIAAGVRGVAITAAASSSPADIAALVAAMTATSGAVGQIAATQRQLGDVQSVIDAAAELAASRVMRDAAMIEADAAQPVTAAARQPVEVTLAADALPTLAVTARLFLQTALAAMISGDHAALERIVAEAQASSMATAYPATIAYTIEAMATQATAGGPATSSVIGRDLALSLASTVVAGAASRHGQVDNAELFGGADAIHDAIARMQGTVDLPAAGAASLILAILHAATVSSSASAEFGRIDAMQIQDLIATLAQTSTSMASVAAIVDSGTMAADAAITAATRSTVRTDTFITGFSALNPGATLRFADAAALAAAGLAAVGSASRAHAGLPVDALVALEAAALASSVGLAALGAIVELLPAADAFTRGHMTVTADAGAAAVAKQALVGAMTSSAEVTQQPSAALRAQAQAALGAAAIAGADGRQHAQAAAAIAMTALLEADGVALMPQVVALTSAALAAAIAVTTHRPPAHFDAAVSIMEGAHAILLAVADGVAAAHVDPLDAIRAADELMAEVGAEIDPGPQVRSFAITLLDSAGDATTEAVGVRLASASLDASGAIVAEGISRGASGIIVTAGASVDTGAIMTLVGQRAFDASGLAGMLSRTVLAGELVTDSLGVLTGAGVIRSGADLAMTVYAAAGQGAVTASAASLTVGADVTAGLAMALRIPANLEVAALVADGTGLAWRGAALLPASAAAIVGASPSTTTNLDARIEGEVVVVVDELLDASIGVSMVSSVAIQPGASLRMASLIALHALAAQLAAGVPTLLPGVRRVLLSAELHDPDALAGADVSRETMQGDIEKSTLTGETARRDSLIGRVYTTITLTGN